MAILRSRRFALASAGVVFAVLAACGGDGGSDSQPALHLPDPAKLFFWTTEEQLVGFAHSDKLYGVEYFKPGAKVFALPKAPTGLQNKASAMTYQYGANPNGSIKTDNSVDNYMVNNKLTGLLVLKNGQVALERYARGVDENTVWDSKSVGKSVVSTLMGVALKAGAIKSLDDTVETYVPELKGSAYEGVNLRQLLRMESGVAWNENYLDPDSDIGKLAVECPQAADPGACLLTLMKSRPRAVDPDTGKPVPPGVVNNYSTGEAHVSGLVVQRATGMSLAKYMEKTIWQPLGMEKTGNWWTWNGVSFGGGAFNASLRDYGRLGLLIANNGVMPDGKAILPDGWVTAATTWTEASAAPGYAPNGTYGYMWWFSPAYDDGVHNAAPQYLNVGAPLQNTTVPTGAVPTADYGLIDGQPGALSDWTFKAIGVFGQMIAINQRENLVIVQWSTWDNPDPGCCDPKVPGYVANNPYNEEATFVNAMTAALH